MAVETEGSRLGVGSSKARRRSLSVLATFNRAIRSVARDLAAQLAEAADGLRSLSVHLHPGNVATAAHGLAAATTKALGHPRALLPRLRAFLISGPLVRFF